jgi:Flp pilus assembly protein TadG
MRLRARRKGNEGQILVIFTLSLVVLIAMVGLVLDGGSTFAQRRQEQNSADLAAIAAANDLIANQGTANWNATALRVAAQNGYSAATGATVTATCINCPGQATDPNTPGVQVTVNITAPHQNGFSAVVGMSSWNVSTTATSLTGWPDTATGPAPFIVSNVNFDTNGKPIHCTGNSDKCNLEHPVSDTPTASNEFTWTNFGYDKKCTDPGNVNDSQLQSYINGYASFSIQLTVKPSCYIAQHNDGVMNNIVAWLSAHAPMTFPVPVVNATGNYVGWATFVMTSATTGGRNGYITGYFESDFQNQSLSVTSPGFGTSTFGGSYELQLVN